MLRRRLQWDREVAIFRRDGVLRVAADALNEPDGEPLTEAVKVLCTHPLAVGGVLPEGAVAVRAPRDWGEVGVEDGAWLAVSRATPAPGALDPLRLVAADGAETPLPPLSEHDREWLRVLAEGPGPPAPLTDAGRAYAAALAQAIAADVAEHPPPGPLRRAVVRWFWEGDPLYLTLHVHGAQDEQPDPEDAWYPLEWTTVDREMERTDRVLGQDAVQAAGRALRATFPDDEDGLPEDGEAHLPAVLETLRLLPEDLRGRGVALEEHFAVAAAHFEGWGLLRALEETAPPELLAALRERGELPED